MINLIPLESLTLDHMVILHNILLISIVVFILSVFFSILCTGTVTAPIQKLVEKMKSASAGKLNISASYSSNDELAVLYNQFNLMMQKIQTLLNDIYEEQNAKQKMEVRLLQSQINPHFLYNTLDSLYFVAIMHGDDQMAEMVEALSDNFKLALNNGSKYIKVADSVKWMQGYMKLQNMRYNNRFELFVDISREILQRETITFIFQPFIENAMYHGLEPKIGKGKISLRGWQEQNNMIFTIEDDGVGIDDMSRLENGYGVRNVIERIKLNYGEKYGVTFESSPGNGTKVTIVVPVR